MNILQILPMLNVGGVETGTADLSIELVKRGHKVIVASNGGRMVKNLLDAGVRHIRVPVHKKSLFTVIPMIRRLNRIIKEEHIEVVHARSRVPAIISFFAARHTGAAFITTAHGYYSMHLLSRVMGWGRFVIVASTVIGRHMIEDFGVPRERIRLIPRGVDLKRFSFTPVGTSINKTEYKIGIVGRITPIKGHAFFLQAIARVVRILSNRVRILIVGDAPDDKPEYKENLKALIRKLKIESCVEFLGSRRDIPEIMSGLDLLVLPSVGQEAFGRVIIEAGASGVPVVATRVGGAVDIIENDRTGILVTPGDIMEMVDSIIKLLKNRPLAKGLASEARKKVEKEYSLVNMVDSTLKVYEDARGRKRILIIKIGAIGDVILAVPSIRAVRNDFPDGFISVLAGRGTRHVLKKCPYIDNLILCDKKGDDKGIKGLMKISGIIRRSSFDISLDLQNNRFSHILAWLGGVPMRFGYDNGKLGFLLNNGQRYVKREEGPVEGQFRILRKAGINTIGASKRLEIWPGKGDFLYVDNLLRNAWLREKQPLVGINIGGRWRTKRWPLRYFVKLSDMLAARDVRVVVTASRDEERLSGDLETKTRSKVINAAGKTTVPQLAALIKRCRVFITGDSAPMHIASAMGTDFIALFGPTHSNRHLEPTDKGVAIQKEVRCGPCYKPECRKPVCMEKIGVDEVYRLVMEKVNL